MQLQRPRKQKHNNGISNCDALQAVCFNNSGTHSLFFYQENLGYTNSLFLVQDFIFDQLISVLIVIYDGSLCNIKQIFKKKVNIIFGKKFLLSNQILIPFFNYRLSLLSIDFLFNYGFLLKQTYNIYYQPLSSLFQQFKMQISLQRLFQFSSFCMQDKSNYLKVYSLIQPTHEIDF
ncbi:hypothetical protein pb186bvf_002291 [Paramecium bursaria]